MSLERKLAFLNEYRKHVPRDGTPSDAHERAIEATCKALGIPNTYESLRKYLCESGS